MKINSTDLTLILIILKFIGVINWSWIWIFSPIWLPIVVLCLLILFVLTGALICTLIGTVLSILGGN